MSLLLFQGIINRPELAGMKKSVMIQVFKENNCKLRTAFFKEPLIKHLWGKVFVVKHHDILITHLIRIQNDSEMKYEEIVKDLKLTEANLNFNLLPTEFKHDENIKMLTENEAFEN